MNAINREDRSRFDKDVAWSAFAMIVPICAGLIALPLLFKNVHQQVFTLFLLSYGAINFAPSLDLGVARTAQRRIAYAGFLAPEARYELLRHALQTAVSVSVAMALIVMIGAAFLFPHQGSMGARVGLIAVTGAGVAIAIYANCQRGILEGLGAFSRSAMNRAVVGIMLVGMPLLVSFFVRNPAILCLSALLVRVPFIWEQQRAIDDAMARRSTAPGTRHEDLISGFMGESAWFALFAILAIAMSGFDRYIMIGLGKLAGEQLTIFLATQDLALRAIMVPAALLPALTVRLAANGGTAATHALTRRLFFVIVPAVLLGCTVGALLSEFIIHLLYPQLPSKIATTTLRILLLGIAVAAISQFPMNRLVSAGRARDVALMHLAEFAIYLASVPFIISRFGAAGGAVLWSGRILLNSGLLIVWSNRTQKDRSAALREGGTVVLGIVAVLSAGFLS